jgi:hypothetical protein
MHTLNCLWALLLLVSINKTYTQCTNLHPPIEERFYESTLVVEGKVVEQQTFYDKSQRFIYTKNWIEPYKLFKGQDNELIQLITLGGVIDNEAMTVSGALEMQIGQSGVFLLKPYAGTRLPEDGSLKYRPVAGKDAYIEYRFDWSEAYDGHHVYPTLAHLYQRLERLSKKKLREIGEADITNPGRNPAMMISEIAPAIANAGIGDTIEINGLGFGEIPGTIFFANADNGGLGYTSTYPWHIISWEEELIKVRVPHKAGTGGLIILGSTGVAFSQEQLNVEFAHTNIVSANIFYQPELVDDGNDADGGYRFTISDNIENGGVSILEEEGAFDAIARSVNAWQDSVGAPLYISRYCETTQLQEPGGIDDNINLITFDNSAWDLDIEVSPYTLAVTISRYARCSGTHWELVDIDIVIRRDGNPNGIGGSIKWSFDEEGAAADELDFQTVMVHELGHALQLQHVVDDNAVMHYSATFGEVKRQLGEEDDEAGADFILDHSFEYEPPQINCWPSEHFLSERAIHPYDPSHECQADTSGNNEGFHLEELTSNPTTKIQVFPNPVSSGKNIKVVANNLHAGTGELTIISMEGRVIHAQQLDIFEGYNEFWISTDRLLPGMYLLQFKQKSESQLARIIVMD